MSYNNYNQGGYDQPNRYDDRGNEGYNSNQWSAQGAHTGGSYNGGGHQLRNDVEMQPLNGYQDEYSRQANNVPLYSRCGEIRNKIDDVLHRELQELKAAYIRAAADPERTRGEVDTANAAFMSTYRDLIAQLKQIKAHPESGSNVNKPQITMARNNLEAKRQEYAEVEKKYRQDTREQARRQLYIVNPNISEADVERRLEESQGGIFADALLDSARVGQANTVRNNVRQRHEEIMKIERQMTELMELFQDLDAMVAQQAPKVEAIEQTTVEAHDNVVKGNTEIDGAIDKARSARRKKWWCLLIVVIILIIIAIIVAIVVTQLQK